MNTKQKLADTLKELMKTTPVDHITVNQLTSSADVARNTFYYHFADINELVAWIYNREIVTQLAVYQRERDWGVGLDVLVTYIENNRHFCLNTFHSLNRDLLSRFLYRVAFSMVAGVVQDLKVDCPATFRDEIANFYGWALATQITQWLVTNLQESKEEFYQRMHRMLNGTVNHVLQNNH
ncbi:TetR family transcriptional regulator [Latilactobacillus curvatus]|nr:TetR family transcriptional regulator [Latilactobacillus curvatus]